MYLCAELPVKKKLIISWKETYFSTKRDQFQYEKRPKIVCICRWAELPVDITGKKAKDKANTDFKVCVYVECIRGCVYTDRYFTYIYVDLYKNKSNPRMSCIDTWIQGVFSRYDRSLFTESHLHPVSTYLYKTYVHVTYSCIDTWIQGGVES